MCIRSAVTIFLLTIVSVTTLSEAKAQVPAWAKVSPEQVAAAKELAVPVAFENSVGMRFVLIPAGTFMMGSRDTAEEVARKCNMPNAQGGWFYDEHPRHKVTLTSAYYMSTTEVSQGCYDAVIYPKPEDAEKKISNQYPDEFQGTNLPIVKVNFSQAEQFCQRLGGLEGEKGRQYFLPTEAQWEYASRAGAQTPFAFGETVSTDQANYHGRYTYGDGKKGNNREKPVPVGSLPANKWGLHEMHGNVSEWCASRYHAYSSVDETDPLGPQEGNERVLRGGSWRSYPGACRSAFRLRSDGGGNSLNVGLRVCCAVPQEETGDPD